MTTHRRSLTALAISVSMAFTMGALAQAPTQPETTEPKAASSPHQREATATQSAEAPTTSSPAASDTASPHQKEVTKLSMADKTKAREQMMKDCMKHETAKNASMSSEQVKKTCTDQVKAQEMKAQEKQQE